MIVSSYDGALMSRDGQDGWMAFRYAVEDTAAALYGPVATNRFPESPRPQPR